MAVRKDADGAAAPVIKAVPLSSELYARYGAVVSARSDLEFVAANQGTAQRYNFLSEVSNLRPDAARLNLCVFSCSPLAKLPLEIKFLEKHHYSTQVFLPMSKSSQYLAVVCLGGDAPDLSTVAAFVVAGPQGVSYRPGVWHYPITALYESIDFACLVHEAGNADDCTIAHLEQPVTVDVADERRSQFRIDSSGDQ